MATQAEKTKKTPEQVEIERLNAEIARLNAVNESQREGKDQTGTYGWTNLSNSDADKIRSLKAGKRHITDAERNRDNEAWALRGDDQKAPPQSNTVERDAQTGKILSAPAESTAKDAAPFEPKPTTDAPADDRVIL
jgi:hypothetical protein